MKKTTTFFLNGSRKEVEIKPETTVLEMLRNNFEMNGIKEGCGEGDCGACTVVLGEVADGRVRYKSAVGCLYLAAKLEGKHLITIEGLAEKDKLHPIQQAVMDAHATQCGFCTPGVILSLLALYLEINKPEKEDFRRYLEGNLCRCTGYISIKQVPEYITKLVISTDEIKPAYLAETEKEQLGFKHEDVFIQNDGLALYSPVSTENLREFLKNNPQYKADNKIRFVNGGSDVVVGIKKRHQHHELLIDLGRIEELQRVDISPEYLIVGGSVSLSKLADSAKVCFPELTSTILLMCSEQVRSTAALAGNIINASPVADTVPLLMAVGADIVLENQEGTRTVPIRNFFHGYKKTEIKPDEWVKLIKIPINKFSFINFEKVTKRKEVDISAVNSAIALQMQDGIIKNACVAYGGVGATTLLMPKTSEYLTGKALTEETFINAADIAYTEAVPIDDVRGSAEYRKAMLKNLMIKHFISSENHSNEVVL